MLSWGRQIRLHLGQMWEHVKHLSFQQLMLKIQISDTALVILLYYEGLLCRRDQRVDATGCLCLYGGHKADHHLSSTLLLTATFLPSFLP